VNAGTMQQRVQGKKLSKPGPRSPMTKRERELKIQDIRTKHVVRAALNKVLKDLIPRLELDERGHKAVAEVLQEFIGKFKVEKSVRDKLVFRFVEQLMPKLTEVKTLISKGIPATVIEAKVRLSHWIQDVDAATTPREIIKMMTRPKVHDGYLVAYEVVGKVREINLSGLTVKKIYNAECRRRGRGVVRR
jgi:hypothetical protein